MSARLRPRHAAHHLERLRARQQRKPRDLGRRALRRRGRARGGPSRRCNARAHPRVAPCAAPRPRRAPRRGGRDAAATRPGGGAAPAPRGRPRGSRGRAGSRARRGRGSRRATPATPAAAGRSVLRTGVRRRGQLFEVHRHETVRDGVEPGPADRALRLEAALGIEGHVLAGIVGGDALEVRPVARVGAQVHGAVRIAEHGDPAGRALQVRRGVEPGPSAPRAAPAAACRRTGRSACGRAARGRSRPDARRGARGSAVGVDRVARDVERAVHECAQRGRAEEAGEAADRIVGEDAAFAAPRPPGTRSRGRSTSRRCRARA